MGRVWFTDFEHISTDFEDLTVVSPRVTNAYFAKKVVTAGAEATGTSEATGPTVDFEEVNEGILGRDVYIIVETENFVPPDQPIVSTERGNVRIQLKTGDCNLTGTTDETIQITDGTADVDEFIAQVGNTEALNDIEGNCAYTNLDDFTDKAIFKLSLRPHTRTTFDTWAETIHDSGTDLPSIEIEVTPEDEELYIVYGTEGNEQGPPLEIGRFANSEGSLFRLENKNVYEIYHGDNLYNNFDEINSNNQQIRRRLGILTNDWARVDDYDVNNPKHLVTYFYHDSNDNEHEVCTTEKIRITEKGPRSNTIPPLASRGTQVPPIIDYRDNQRAGEDISASTLTKYTNGVHAIEYTKTEDPNNPGNYIISNNILRERWYPVPNANSFVYMVNADIEQEAGMGSQVFTGLDYVNGDLRIRYCFKDTRRRHAKPDLLAALIGAIAQFNEGDTDAQGNARAGLNHRICGEGFSYEDGSCYPSTSHRNGLAGDLYYLSTGLTGVEVLLQDSDFDYTNQVIFCDLLYDFGWSRTGNSLSENFTNPAIGINSSTILPHSSHVTTPRHNNHHHIQRFSNNFVQNLLP
ncbi:hypothetical protein [Aquimarina sp. RZ0]|uniref:hypothetical protein n=1 Tax=Aquimarina sp. RZ0 TaxID=2607730 RepID=UPI0011F0ED6E|nr:hypothetical protein [Aquimarina sp. RZ0]KAA1241583.1 hypothetical protein F0000_26365 [Aquimarina sp. RZ0]